MLHPETATRFVSNEVGLGVFSTAALPRGTIVWTQDVRDRVVSSEELRGLRGEERRHVEVYGHRDEWGRTVVCWDAGRLINHSCDPSLRGIGPWFMVARRDIERGEQITCDYAECNLEETMRCLCGERTCRTWVRPGDLGRFGPAWDEEARSLLSVLRDQRQVLWPYLLRPSQARAWIDETVALPPFERQYIRLHDGHTHTQTP